MSQELPVLVFTDGEWKFLDITEPVKVEETEPEPELITQPVNQPIIESLPKPAKRKLKKKIWKKEKVK